MSGSIRSSMRLSRRTWSDEARERLLAQVEQWVDALDEPLDGPLTSEQQAARNARFWAAIERLDQLGETLAGIELRRQLALHAASSDLNWMYAYLAALDKLARGSGSEELPAPRIAALNAQAASAVQAWLEQQPPSEDPQQLEFRSQMALALAQRGGARRALPFLRELALDNEAVDSVYRAALAELGEKGELIAYLGKLSGRLTGERARVIADELLALGQKSMAEPIYRLSASAAGPKAPEVSQLLYVWGPRPGPVAIAWLLERMRAAPPNEKAIWGEYALERGGAARLARAMKEGGWATSDPKLALIYLRAVAQSADKHGLREQIAELIGTAKKVEVLRGVAKLADAQSLPDLAVAAYGELLRVLPRDIEGAEISRLECV